MRKNIFKKIISIVLCVAMMMALSALVVADDFSNIQDSTYLCNQRKQNQLELPMHVYKHEIARFDRFVILEGEEFAITEEALFELTGRELSRLNEIVNERNSVLNRLLPYATSYIAVGRGITIAEISNDHYGIESAWADPGVNAVQFFWWGMRIFLSADTVRVIGAGVAIAGIWIPLPVVNKVVATLGVAISLINRGIWFDTTYLSGLPNVPSIIRSGWQ